jgi:signal peptidase I
MLWLIFAFSVYGFAGPPVWFYNVPSGSMADTLLVGDVFLAAMDAYAADDPHRGDVAVFERNGTTYVKRVIGLPGDRVQMINGRLVLNRKPVEREPASDKPISDEPPGARLYVETLPDGARYETLQLEQQGFLDNTKEFRVPAGYYFVLGDNRDNSLDSRSPQVGFVPRERFVGRATTLLFSLTPEDREWRGDRFLQPIH